MSAWRTRATCSWPLIRKCAILQDSRMLVTISNLVRFSFIVVILQRMTEKYKK